MKITVIIFIYHFYYDYCWQNVYSLINLISHHHSGLSPMMICIKATLFICKMILASFIKRHELLLREYKWSKLLIIRRIFFFLQIKKETGLFSLDWIDLFPISDRIIIIDHLSHRLSIKTNLNKKMQTIDGFILCNMLFWRMIWKNKNIFHDNQIWLLI